MLRVFALFILVFSSINAFSQRTQLILLGTGTPNVDLNRSGPALAIVVDGRPYVVDCGRGVVQGAFKAGIPVKNLNRLFITHLHSDHTSGYADFLLTPAVLERTGPLLVLGPKGTKALDENIHKAYQEDIDIRLNGAEHGNPKSYQTIVTDMQPGEIYKDSLVTVTAFKVEHGTWPEAFGFRFKTPDKTIVVSGDCTYSTSIIDACNGCDILVHEVYSEKGFATRPPKWKNYHSKFHTSTSQLASIANQAKPKLLVLTHQLLWGTTVEDLLKEIKSKYPGDVVSGNDQDKF